MTRKYELPAFLENIQTQEAYDKWLSRKAKTHVKRDRTRGNLVATVASYKIEIHRAVLESFGNDAYTGEQLDWSLISSYNNSDSKALKREYKKKFELLPSVDHVDNGISHANFKICGWRTNDCKNDLSEIELRSFCVKILKYHKERT